MCKTYSGSIINGRDIDSASMELINQSLIMISSHTCPATITNLAIKDVY